ncbi:MAG: hypothetical protein JXN10_04380 [Clostridia bacterium]|nr:hypothetical protein [Clostridia bacterium]MBN2882741.1 hypothetical protein [Clostridia bacterium]
MHKACSDKIKYLDELINGLLDKEKEAILFRHLENCENCSKYYSDMTALKKALGSLNISAPDEIVPNIMKAVKIEVPSKVKKNPRWLRPAYIASYATAACLVAAITVIFLNGGFFNKGMQESAELFENEQQIKSAESDRYAGGENGIASEDTLSDAASAPLPIPAPGTDSMTSNIKEPGLTAEILDDREFSFYSSAFAGDFSLEYNSDGADLAKTYGFSDSQDIFYVTANYNNEEIVNILFNEYGIKPIESWDNYILVQIPVSLIAPIEKRLDLAASGLVDEDLLSYTARIVALN